MPFSLVPVSQTKGRPRGNDGRARRKPEEPSRTRRSGRRAPRTFNLPISSAEGKGQPDEHLPLKTKDLGSLYINLAENTLVRWAI